ncbi:uncharacterized protein DUF397 [Actinomadura pelletieri DSM 43383]|uniref:Uncharacterized protein DUF397 n=1 Tax=Actinomadura pelletieri DSM 43383 TaxID=1120940 RepID=A0A495QG20_9ACTN|nr:DUF397 domain-containing protein [Actinomadura pelletieri]RKS70860.1 uncharacterized protein DUF397 [Actinomadura pelletieri DSM 43383]
MTEWRKSSHSGTGAQSDCVEMAALPGAVGIRDSKAPDGPRFALPASAARELLTRIKRET